MTIDLTDFIPAGHKPKRNPNKQDKLEDLRAPKIPYGQITCTQCVGTGTHKHTVRHIVPGDPQRETLLENLGHPPQGIPTTSERIKCAKCDGTGFHTIPNRFTPVSVVQWWSRYSCKCGYCYEAPSFANSITIKYSVEAPIIRNGVLHGYRYKETVYKPSIDFEGSTLPYEIEYHEVAIRVCRKCAQSRMIILLKGDAA